MTRDEIARLIDHTRLKPETTGDEIERLCLEAIENRFASVCIAPFWVPFVRRILESERETGLKICTVIGFPLGAQPPVTKVAEAERGLADGADELDMVMNIGAFLSGANRVVQHEIEVVADLLGSEDLVLKIILETSLLSSDQIVEACRIAADSGADFVKTSTGFTSVGATVENVRLMHHSVPPSVGIKASGGIGSGKEAMSLIEAGAARLGTSRSVAILDSL